MNLTSNLKFQFNMSNVAQYIRKDLKGKTKFPCTYIPKLVHKLSKAPTHNYA
ncbi:hypothetical protein RHMOL_Rhmol11G0223300 [Rhododendron molle]|uniref:Uncharacterized protein n=1 Tax=Rhododendron molle TaxID=49168 RepID=A0ACC0LWD2_RHOML|nr:hypothetical protein RHMOL_Rhmol11G0223300 [Rhododendron molle]